MGNINFSAIDKPLFYASVILFLGGIMILASSSMVLSLKTSGSLTFYVLRQVMLGGFLGVVGFGAAIMIPYRYWKSLSLPLMILSFILLALLFIPELGYAIGGAKRWLHLGPISFQPSELLKFAFIAYLASWLDARRDEVKTVSFGMIPFALMLAIVGMFLIMQPDIGTLGVIVVTSGILYFLGGGKISQIASLTIFGMVILYFVVQMAPYRLDRISVFWNPELDPRGSGYQITQALIAIGSGGVWGMGFGKGLQKYNYLPEPMGDSIFAILAEELGFLGVIFLVGLFGYVFWRGLTVAKKAPDIFGKLLAAGLSIGLITQAFTNMAAISGLIPLTGIPLPFISYGGTSLAMTLTSIGVILNISKNT